jgi:hypothetical protein
LLGGHVKGLAEERFVILRRVILDFDESMSREELQQVADYIEGSCDIPCKTSVEIGECGGCARQNKESAATTADNTTQAAIALLRRWIIPTTDDQDDMSTLQAETESFIAQHAAVR